MNTNNAAILVPMRGFLETLLEHRDLTEKQSVELLRGLTNADTPPALAGAILAALRAKGVVAAELRGFAVAMRALARRPAIAALSLIHISEPTRPY